MKIVYQRVAATAAMQAISSVFLVSGAEILKTKIYSLNS